MTILRTEDQDAVYERVRLQYQRQQIALRDLSEQQVQLRFQNILAIVKKPHFGNLNSPGAHCEYDFWRWGHLDEHLANEDQQLLADTRAADSKAAREELNELAWLATAQHGFAALADIPELQQIVAYTCMAVYNHHADDSNLRAAARGTDAERYRREMLWKRKSLLQHLPPQLRICLLAEVAAGLICPGLPLPPDTPEHGAALQEFVELAVIQAKDEARDTEAQGSWYHGDNALLLHRHAAKLQQQMADLHVQPEPHQVLDTVAKVVCSDASSDDSSSNSSNSSNSSDISIEDLVGPAVASAVDVLLRSWIPCMQLQSHMQHLQEQQQQHNQQLQEGVTGHHSSSLKDTNLERSGDIQAASVANMFVVGQKASQTVERRHYLHSSIGSSTAQQQLPKQAQELVQQLAQLAASIGGLAAKWHSTQQEEGPALAAEVVSEQLRVLGGTLVFQFLAAGRAAGGVAWQQEVPLQVLLLLAALEQLQGMCLVVVKQQSTAAAAESAQQQCSQQQQQHLQDPALDACGQQQQQHCCPAAAAVLPILQKMCEIIQLTRSFQHVNQQLNNSAVAAAAAVDASSHVNISTLSDNSSGLAWSALGAVTGPLANNLPGPYTLAALGSGAALLAGGGSSNSILGCNPQRPAAAAAVRVKHDSSNGNEKSSNASLQQQQQQQHGEVLTSQASAVHIQQLRHDAFLGALLLFFAQQKAHRVMSQLCWDPSRTAEVAEAEELRADDEDLHEYLASAVNTAQHCKLEVSSFDLAMARNLGQHALQDYKRCFDSLLAQYGADSRWMTVYDVGYDVQAQQQLPAKRAQEAAGSSRAKQQQQPSASSQTARGDSEKGAMVQQVQKGGRSIIELDTLSKRLVQPIRDWLDIWWHDRQQRFKTAKAWWGGGRQVFLEEQRQQAGRSTSRTRSDASKPSRPSNSSTSMLSRLVSYASSWSTNDSSSSSSKPAEEASAPGQGAAAASGKNRRVWQAGLHDRCAGCPLCQKELDIQNAAGAGGRGSHDQQQQQRPYSAWPVSYSDPCMWRRLLWQLLGKVKPSAQEFWATKFAVCPHCPDGRLWECIGDSVLHNLWVPPDADPVLQQVAGPDALGRNRMRTRRLLQYARAINKAALQSYSSPAAALLSQQVLLSLSPLHQQMAPGSQAVPLFPSSAGAVAARVLLNKLGVSMGQLLKNDRKQLRNHPTDLVDGTLTWHFWWHMGIMRFHWQQQQQGVEAFKGQQHSGSSGSSAADPKSSSNSRSSCDDREAHHDQQRQQQPPPHQQYQISPDTLQQLYMDADARYYAAGFAARQIAPYGPALQLRQAFDHSPHVHRFHRLTDKVREYRMQYLRDKVTPAGGAGRVSDNALEQLVMLLERDQHQAELLAAELFPPPFRPADYIGLRAEEYGFSSLPIGDEDRHGDAALLMPEDTFESDDVMNWVLSYQRVMFVCDVCEQLLDWDAYTRQEVCQVWYGCSACGCAVYCSQECEEKDERHHAALCGHLQETYKRYAPNTEQSSGNNLAPSSLGHRSRASSSSTNSSSSAGAPGGYQWRVLELLEPEAGVFGINCGAMG